MGDDPDASLLPRVAWIPAGRGQMDCHVITWDRAGLFGRIAGAFAVAGINILSCRAFSRSDHVALDIFRVALPEDAEAARERFRATLEDCFVRQADLRTRVLEEEARILRRAPVRKSGLGQDPVVRVYDAPELGRRVLELLVPDRLGLLFHIGSAIREAGYALTFANVATERGYAIDTFYLIPEPSIRLEPEDATELERRIRDGLVSSKA